MINLKYSMSQDFLPLTTDLAEISDEDLAKELSRVLAIVSVTLDCNVTASGKSLSNVWFLSVPWHRP